MHYAELCGWLARSVPTVLIVVTARRGSAPREVGAAMAVSPAASIGTIGGGHLEWKAMEQARAMLAEASPATTRRRYPLGPALGQCCGGAVELAFVPLRQVDGPALARLARAEAEGRAACIVLQRAFDDGHSFALPLAVDGWTVAVFGAGHVGGALVTMLSALPCEVRWIDTRADAFAAAPSDRVRTIVTDAPEADAMALPSGADVLVMTHSHALDLEICLALAVRTDLGFIGLIGSDAKAVRFRRQIEARLGEAAADRIICPVGDRRIANRHPGMIAAGIVADLARRRTRVAIRAPRQDAAEMSA